MAIIPKAQINKMVSTDVSRRPTQSIESAGLVGKGIESFAKGLGDIGQVFAQVDAQQAKIEADTMSQKLVDDAMEDIHEEEKYLKLNTKGNHAQYAAEHRKKVENIKNFVLKRKDISDLTKKVFTSRFANVERRAAIGASEYQLNQRKNFILSTKKEMITSTAQRLSTMPDSYETVKSLNTVISQLKDSSTFTQEEQKTNELAARDEIFTGYMNGLENENEPEEALEVLNGENPHSKEILKTIAPEKVQTWRRRFERQMKTKAEVNKSLFNSQIQDLESFTFDNREKAPQGFIESLEQNSIALGDRKAYGKIQILKKSNEMIQSIKEYDTEDLNKLRTGLSQSPEFKVLGIQDAAEKNRLAKRMNSAIDQMIKFRNEKGADFAMEVDKSLVGLSAQAAALEPEGTKAYLEKTETVQKAKGIANTKLLTDAMAEAYEPLFNVKDGETLDPVAVKKSVIGFKEAFGKNTPKAVEELIDRKIIDRATSYAFYSDDPKQIENIISLNTTDTDTLIEASKETFSKAGTDLKSESENMFVDSSIQEYENALAKTIGKKEAILRIAPLKALAVKSFAKYAATESIDNAKKKALEDFASQWTTLNADENVIIPTSQLNKMSLGKGRLEETLDLMRVHAREITEAYEVPVPDQYKAVESSPEKAKEKFASDIRSKGMWLTSSDMTGVVLYMDNGTERPSVVPGKGGKPIKVTWQELHNGFDWQYLNKDTQSKLVTARQERIKNLNKISEQAWSPYVEGF